MKRFNRDAFRKAITIKKTYGNRVFQFMPTKKDSINRMYPQLQLTYQRLLPIKSMDDLGNAEFNLMLNLMYKPLLNLKPNNIYSIDIIDTYFTDDNSTVIYLYDAYENLMGKIITCAPPNLFYQVIHSRCPKSKYWSIEEETEKNIPLYLPKYTRP